MGNVYRTVLLSSLFLTMVLGQWEKTWIVMPPEGSSAYNYVNLTSVTENSATAIIKETIPVDGNVTLVLKFSGTTAPIQKKSGSTGSLIFTMQSTGIGSDSNLVLVEAVDYETYKSYTYTYELTTFGIRVLTVRIQDENDNTPQFVRGINQLSYPENALGIVYNFTANDRDELDKNKLQYSLTESPNNGNHFAMETVANVGQLKVISELDYEVQNLFLLDVVVTDTAGHNSTWSLNLQVSDMPDEPPKWSVIQPVVRMKESGEPAGSKIGDVVTKVSAYDGDLGIRNAIQYSISGDQAPYFSMDKTTGELTLAKTVDRDLNESVLEVTVIASEQGEISSRAEFNCTVFVDDINDQSPTFSYKAFTTSVDEDYRTSFIFAEGNIHVADTDLGDNGRYSLTIEGPCSSKISVSPVGSSTQDTTYTLSVRTGESLDYEDASCRNISLKLTATEQANTIHRDEATVFIEIKDINDNEPFFLETNSDGGYSADVMENITTDTNVFTVRGDDRDTSPEFGAESLQYTLLRNENSKSFSISQDGVITYNGTKQLDRESQDTLDLLIQLSDGPDNYGTSYKTTATLTLTLLDVNDTPPKLEIENSACSVQENCGAGIVVVTGIVASDSDINPDLEITIDFAASKFRRNNAPVQSLPGYDFTQCFDIKSTNVDGNIAADVVVGSLSPDREQFDSVDLVIKVEDKHTEVGSSVAKTTLSITVTDVNDNAPTFVGAYTNWELQEEKEDGTVVNMVRATDSDENANSVITYTLESCEYGEGFIEVNATTGAVVARSIDRETTPNISCTISACDNDDPPLSSNTSIFIKIDDINDVVPHFTEDFGKIVNIREDAANGTIITQVSAKDEDTGDYGFIMYIFSQNNVEGMDEFQVNSTTGIVTVKNANLFDFDKGKKSYSFFIEARDNFRNGAYSGSNANSTLITVNLLDVNDNAPILPSPGTGCYALVSEAESEGFVVVTVKAEDIDDPNLPNSQIDYTLVSESEQFRVDSTTNGANVTVKSPLRGSVGNYTLTIQAADNGVPQQKAEENYVICVLDENDNSPIFIFPTANDTVVYVQETNPVNGPVKYIDDNSKLQDLYFLAKDVDTGENARVTYVFDSETPSSTFSLDPDSGLVTLQEAFDKTRRNNYTLVVIAQDHGVPKQASRTNLLLYVRAESKYDPEFNVTSEKTSFKENQRLCNSFTAAVDLDNKNLLPDEKGDPIVYFLVGGNTEYFTLDDPSTARLCTKSTLDREDPNQIDLYAVVQVTNGTQPTESVLSDANSKSFLRINVTIIDENDNAPSFGKAVVSAGIWPNSPTDVVRVQATDPDEQDVITYNLSGEFTVSDPSLNSAMTSTKNEPFRLDPQTGSITTRFTVQSDMRGYFQSVVTATDKVKNSSDAILKIFIVNVEENQVTIYFLDPLENVEAQRLQIENIFTEVYEYTCNVESINQGLPGSPDKNRTKVLSHFIDETKSEPVPKTEIERLKNNYTKTAQLRSEFTAIGLSLDEILTVYPSEASQNQTFFILFIVLCVVLVSLLIVLFVVLVRSKELNHRIKALSSTKFGSQDSGINRAGVASVPNTNKHTIEGSNPIWNADERVLPQDDAISQSSGDSVLIGVENNPEFRQYKNKGFEPDSSKAVPFRKPKSTPLAVNPVAVRKHSAPNLEPYDPRNTRDTRRPSEPNFSAFPLDQTTRTNPLFASDSTSERNQLNSQELTGTGKRRAPLPPPPQSADHESEGDEAIYDRLNHNFSFGDKKGNRTEL